VTPPGPHRRGERSRAPEVAPSGAALGAPPPAAAGLTAWLFLLPGFAALVLPALRPPADADTFWHLRAGHDLLAGRGGVFTEAWSFTASGRPWINHEWLAEGTFAAAERVGGEAGVVLLAALLLLAAGLLVARTALRAGVPAGVVSLGLVLAALVAGDRFVPRPQLFTYVLLALVLERAQALRGATSLRGLLVLPLAQLFWTNLHGPVPGLALSLLLVFGGAFPNLVLRDRAALVALVLGASLAHPQGPRVLADSVQHLAGDGLYRRMVSEWLPLLDPVQAALLARPWTIGLAAAAALLALLALTRPAGRGRAVWPLLLLGVAAAPFAAVRNRDLLAFGVLPALAGLWPAFGRVPRPVGWSAALGALALALAIAGGAIGPRAWPPRLSLDRTGFPVEATAFLERSGSAPLRIVNAYDFGGYLVHALPPGWTIGIDGRYFVYGEALVRDYLALRDAHPGSRERLTELGADLLLLRYPGADGYGALARQATTWPEWSLVYWDDQALLFARQSGRTAALRAGRESGIFDPTNPPRQEEPSWWREHFRAVVRDCWRAAIDAPRSAKPLLALGLAFEYNGRDGDALRFYREVEALYPGHRLARGAAARVSERHAAPPSPTSDAALRAEFGLPPRPPSARREGRRPRGRGLAPRRFVEKKRGRTLSGPPSIRSRRRLAAVAAITTS
jgi:hypothetical protein